MGSDLMPAKAISYDSHNFHTRETIQWPTLYVNIWNTFFRRFLSICYLSVARIFVNVVYDNFLLEASL